MLLWILRFSQRERDWGPGVHKDVAFLTSFLYA